MGLSALSYPKFATVQWTKRGFSDRTHLDWPKIIYCVCNVKCISTPPTNPNSSPPFFYNLHLTLPNQWRTKKINFRSTDPPFMSIRWMVRMNKNSVGPQQNKSACSKTDGSVANSDACPCGTSYCYASVGLYCISSVNFCGKACTSLGEYRSAGTNGVCT